MVESSPVRVIKKPTSRAITNKNEILSYYGFLKILYFIAESFEDLLSDDFPLPLQRLTKLLYRMETSEGRNKLSTKVGRGSKKLASFVLHSGILEFLCVRSPKFPSSPMARTPPISRPFSFEEDNNQLDV